ncbi:unnamed protein product, partial [Phaeothamnion confervicola]
GGRGRGDGRQRNGRSAKLLQRRQFWSQQLCTPEWMTEVPPDLNGKESPAGQGWYVLARPEGKRVLVVAAHGQTTARDMSGVVSRRWASLLPGGSPATTSGAAGAGTASYSILDCVYHELNRTYYVLDMMCWKGYSLYDCTADFRFYWVRTKLAEEVGVAP